MGHSLQRAQVVLMRKLDIIGEQDIMSQEARDAYAALFEHPLLWPHLATVAAIFGWEIPEDGEARSANLLQVQA